MTNIWFGKTTTKWAVVPLREVASLGTGHTPSRSVPEYWENCTIPWVTVDDIRKHGPWSLEPLMQTGQEISELGLENSAAVVHPKGTVMLSRTASIGFSCVIGKPMATTQAFVCWTPNPRMIDSDYLHAALKAMGQKYDQLSYGATHLTIYFPDIKTLRVPCPPLEVQKQIATFLKRQLAKIECLISEQQKLIDILQEKRQAVVSHAVTKGLNPDAPMKPSGVEWFGEVPAHWEVSPVRLVARLESGHTPSRNRPEYWQDCTVPWFSLSDIWQVRKEGRIYISETKEQVSEIGLANSAARKLPAGTVMLSRTASVGFPAIMKREMATTQDFANWVCGEQILPEYLYFCFRAMSQEFERLRYGSTHNTIYMPDIRRLRVGLPPIDEQAKIVDYILRSDAKLRELIQEAEGAIDLLKLRRSSLISEAVTGKIDVRDHSSDMAVA